MRDPTVLDLSAYITQPSNSSMPTTLACSAPTMPTTHAWSFNERLHIITHEPRACNICAAWANHYVQHILNHTPSLHVAESKRDEAIVAENKRCDEAIVGELKADNAELDDQVQSLTLVLDEACSERIMAEHTLDETRDKLQELTNQLATLQSKYDDLQSRSCASIADLRAQIADLEARPHKAARQDPSPPASSQTSSETPMDKDHDHSSSWPASAPPQLLSRLQPLDPQGDLNLHAPDPQAPELLTRLSDMPIDLIVADVEMPASSAGGRPGPSG